MAGDWIKVRTDLDRDPAVIFLADHYGWPEHVIVGLLVKLWSWADGQVSDGNAPGVTTSFVNRYLQVSDFAELLVTVGWLDTKEGQICFPNWERHMSESAKKRAKTRKRVSKHREITCNAKSVTEALPEKRREEKKEKKKKTPVNGWSVDVTFGHFWKVFPPGRKRSKATAWAAWPKAIAKAAPEIIIAGAEAYAASDEAKGKYVSAPGPWLNQERWEDDPLAWQDKTEVKAAAPDLLEGWADQP